MPSGRVIFACSLAASAAIHAVLWWTLPRGDGYVGSRATTKPKTPTPTLIVLPPEEKPPEPPPAIFGEKTGAGVAENASAGDQPQAGPQPLVDQAALSRDPTGQGPAAEKPKLLAQPVTAPPPAALPTPPPSPALSFRPMPKPAPPAPTPRETPPESTPQPPKTVGTSPLPQSDEDSDPFAKEWAADFRNGEVVSRTGRQLKMMRPKFNDGVRAQVTDLGLPRTTTFKVRIDETGQVREATIANSSGSPSLDRAFQLSIYQSWFEPAKNKDGKPAGDSFTFSWTIPR